jgi:hypothetical protein
MSSNTTKPYRGPSDFRMMREIVRRAGYRLNDTAVNRAAHLAAAKMLILEFRLVRRPYQSFLTHPEPPKVDNLAFFATAN